MSSKSIFKTYTKEQPLIKNWSDEAGKWESLYNALENFVSLVQFRTAIEDHGIGDYEFWGDKCCDKQLVGVLQDTEEGWCLLTILTKDPDDDPEWFTKTELVLNPYNSKAPPVTRRCCEDIEYREEIEDDSGEEMGEVKVFVKQVEYVREELIGGFNQIVCLFEFAVTENL